MKSVQLISDHKLCSACGVCINVCPQKAISFIKNDGTYTVNVNKNCTDCGFCTQICTATNTSVSELYEANKQTTPDDLIIGNFLASYNMTIRNENVLLNSASGGFVTGTVSKLLEDKLYDCAFLVKGYNYSQQLKSEKTTSVTPDTARSRYISVSMENLVKEMLENRNERIIICAVPCAVQAITNVIQKFNLHRENYLIIGLFCEHTHSYAINDYFTSLSNKTIKELYFKDKAKNGWPGDVKLVLNNGKTKYFPSSKRKFAKKYYRLKRCLTCFDKLNCLADISVGDNYTKHDYNKNGSNSVIVRTAIGEKAFNSVYECFDVHEVKIQDIAVAQSVSERMQNFKNASILTDIENVTVYTDITYSYTQNDKENYINLLNETTKDILTVKKEIAAKERRFFINKIKRKLKIKL